MAHISNKIAVPIILAGIFIIVIFMALEADKLDASFYFVFFLVAVYIFLFGFATGQRFAMPVKKVLEEAQELSKGDLKARVYVESKDEIEDIAKNLNKIAEEMEESQEEKEAAEKAIDLKVRARTKDLEETITALEQKVKNRTIETERLSKELEQYKPKG